MAEIIYIDETGSVGAGASNQPVFTVVAVIVPESSVRPLAESMESLARTHLGAVPVGFEFHGSKLWQGSQYWSGKQPAQLLAAYSDVIGLLQVHGIKMAHASIDKPCFSRKYDGRHDSDIYLLALQFLLEKVEARGTSDLKIVVADQAKEQELRAVKLVADLQTTTSGIVPGQQIQKVIDTLHFVRSSDSPGVQLADMVAYILQRKWYKRDKDQRLVEAISEMYDSIIASRLTYRDVWPSCHTHAGAAFNH